MKPKPNKLNLQDFIARAERMGMKVKVNPDSQLLVASESDKNIPAQKHGKKKAMMKLFTHNDTDGVSCGILGKLAFGDQLHIEYCNYDDVNTRILKFMNDYLKRYEKVFITDISVNEALAEQINHIETYEKKKFTLLDHHQTAEWLNKYEWAQVKVTENKRLASGTSLFYAYLLENNYLTETPEVAAFVELVRQYDTWDWKENNNSHAKQLNDLFYITGRERFLNRFVKNSSPEFTDAEKMILELEQDKIDKYIKSKAKDVHIKKIRGYVAGIVFAEQYVSELGNALAEQYPDVDFIAMVNMGRVISYRTVKNNINVSEIASLFGGGGHQKAAGSPVAFESKQRAIELLFGE